MLNAAEQQIYASAEDDKERTKLRTRLYAPPRPIGRQARPTSVPAAPEQQKAGPTLRMPAASVAELLARIDAEDARFGS